MSQLEQIFKKVFSETFFEVWRFKIFSADQNPITVGNLVVALAVLCAGYVFSKLITRTLSQKLEKKKGIKLSTIHTFRKLNFYIFIFFFFMFSLKIANIPLTAFAIFGSALAIGFGFGSQNLVKNFISGIILMFEQPIKPGDFVEVNGSLGKIDTIGLRCTRMAINGNRHLVVPNSYFLESNFINWTLQNQYVMWSFLIGVAYDSDVDLVKKTLKEATVLGTKKIIEKEPVILVHDFGDSAIVFKVYYWVHLTSLFDKSMIESSIKEQIIRLFREKNLIIPFPQRELSVQYVGNTLEKSFTG